MTSPNQPLIVIPCARLKWHEPAPAGKFYIGRYHQACRQAADALTRNGGQVLILSGGYGLVTLDQRLEPYDTRIDDPDAVTPDELRAQARALAVDQADDVTVLAGAKYAAAARSVWPRATAPLHGLGIGRQLQRLAQIRDGAATAVQL
ncbi:MULTISPECIES: DUF6884 domain-containing protein [unclassified Streptomyces]|uniref:DUF6884 domain-containing protein n=1 Tax=unclassified Streptomyces TaxID=2593676 RepID=UPI0003761085|nr:MULTISPECIES: DUF6884 domain-containing protein [unclassified Streptomyces]MYX39012.1 hypothetical protein [Streptomyces sp. SID8377]